MRTPVGHEQGLVAILDALGAASYSESELASFLDSRARVLRSLNQKAEAILGNVSADMISTFTFNDTVLVVLRMNGELNVDQVTAFFILLRKFLVDSMANHILFRGAISIGSFHANDETNTVMGQAVTDAASWYDRADWIGVYATPRATLLINQLLEEDGEGTDGAIVEYAVPMKDGSSPSLKVVNWPRAFFVRSLSPCKPGQSRRARLLELFGSYQIPLGTEQKYFHTLSFFDWVVKFQSLNRQGKRHPIR